MGKNYSSFGVKVSGSECVVHSAAVPGLAGERVHESAGKNVVVALWLVVMVVTVLAVFVEFGHQ